MLSIRKINPMFRAVGTMGVVAALAGGITFANLNSNTVKLTNNTLDSATAGLQIQSGTEGPASSVDGINTALIPGTPVAYTFYLESTGQTPLSITANVPTDVSSSQIPPADITLSFDCGNGPVTYTLDQWAAGSAVIPGGALPAGGTWTCSETATLSSSYGGQGGQTVKPFTVDFVGNQ